MSKANANIEINVIFADGSRRSAVISQSAVNLVKRYARLMPSLFEGTGFNPLNADVSSIVAVTRADHDAFHQIPHTQRERDAIKRRLIELFDHSLFPDYENDLLADDFIASGVTFSDFTQIPYDSGRIIGEKQAIFRLGQMDMQVSVCDMLRAMANGAAEGVRPGLTLAADLVETMEVSKQGESR